MIHLIYEGNSELNNRRFMIPDGVRKYLQSTLDSYNGSKTIDGYKRLNNLLSEESLSYLEMKRIKNFFDNYAGTDKSDEFILNGGEPMKTWVNNILNTATTAIRDFKQAKKDAGFKNAFRKPHEKQRQIKKNKPTVAKIKTNNMNRGIVDNDSIKFESVDNKSIVLTEEQYRCIISESQESKSIDAAKKLYMQRTGQSAEEADEFVRITLRNDIPVLRDKQAGKFILGVTRMFLDRQLTDGMTISNLNRTLKYVASDAHINEYDRNLNGMSADELIDRFATNAKEETEADRQKLASKQYGNSNYKIVKIDSFDESKRYNRYMGEGAWCITYDENMWDSYTSNGINQFYFCLRNGFENVPAEPGENCPLDEYGLSMIAVSVRPDGSLNTCTCRWNHDNGGNDNIMTTEQISDVVGANFYSVFKGNEEYVNLYQKCKELGIDINSLEFNDGFALFLQDKNKYNFINKYGELISPNQWFDDVCDYFFYNGYTNIKLNGKWYELDKNANLYYDGNFVRNLRDGDNVDVKTETKEQPNKSIVITEEQCRRILSEAQGIPDGAQDMAEYIVWNIYDNMPDAYTLSEMLDAYENSYDYEEGHTRSVELDGKTVRYTLMISRNKNGEESEGEIYVNYRTVISIISELLKREGLVEYDDETGERHYDLDTLKEISGGEYRGDYDLYGEIYDSLERMIPVVVHELTHKKASDSGDDNDVASKPYAYGMRQYHRNDEYNSEIREYLYLIDPRETNSRVASSYSLFMNYLTDSSFHQLMRNDDYDGVRSTFDAIMKRVLNDGELKFDLLNVLLDNVKEEADRYNEYKTANPDDFIYSQEEYTSRFMNESYAFLLAANDTRILGSVVQNGKRINANGRNSLSNIKNLFKTNPLLFTTKVYNWLDNYIKTYKQRIYKTCWSGFQREMEQYNQRQTNSESFVRKDVVITEEQCRAILNALK